jgi:hypothetical protein
MTVGEDLRVEQALDYAGKTLVGRFFGLSLLEPSIWEWIGHHWEILLGY